ncbi:hypothetical protein ACFWVC_10640 [Streptomyces sp. NPDC058691]|uniref:hypothetical protein n=1 Tax=Streptomyces sp. NPDC058691 TaxID=3346601 RepID=UPI003661FAC4
MSTSHEEPALFSDPDLTAPAPVRGPAPVLDPFHAPAPAGPVAGPRAGEGREPIGPRPTESG